MARPASVSMIGLVIASSAAMLLARFSTSATALYICCAHRAFEIEGFDDAHAENRFLHDLDDLGDRQELHLHDALAGRLRSRLTAKIASRTEDQGDERQHRLLDDHDQDEADQRKQVAHEGGDEDVDHGACGLGALRQCG